MRDRYSQSPGAPALAPLILVLVSLAGLIAGILTHGLVSAASGKPTAKHTPATATTHPASTPRQAPTVVATAAGPNAHFSLAMTFAPAAAHSGGALTITVRASANGTSAPVAHLLCALSAPGGGSPLLTSWPAPAATNGQGIATWQVNVPNLAPGRYGVKVSASSTDGYSAFWVNWVQVTS